jgi:TonB family protein
MAAVVIFLVATASAASNPSFPKPTFAALPVYPEGARAARVAGVVKLWFVLNNSGEVAHAEVASGNPLLREAAVEAVKSWRFQPNTLPSKVRFETEFTYVLKVQAREGEPKLTVSMTDFRHVEIVSELYVKPIE